MTKIWRYHPDQCDVCGSDTEILTAESLPEGHGYDGDNLRCEEGHIGSWNVCDEDEAYADWDSCESNWEE